MRVQVTRLLLGILLALPILQGVSNAQPPSVPQPITPIGAVIDYQAREAVAPPAIQTMLAVLRRQIADEGLTFTVGYTFALDFSIPEITGMTDPPTEPEPIPIQEITGLIPPNEQPAAIGCASALSFDWRSMNGVTPVRDQGNCGSCWAFGTHGAFEGSYKIVNDIVSDVDTSEQDTLDCSGAGSCQGGWWAFDNLINRGSATEAAYPYTATDGSCRLGVSRLFNAVAWDYVSSASTIPSVLEIKEALCQHGPLAVAVAATPLFQAYTGGVFNEGSTALRNHAVTLIGWDDDEQAWLIKNSWGLGWGIDADRGHMRIRYGSNSIGMAAAWVDAKKLLRGAFSQFRGRANGIGQEMRTGLAITGRFTPDGSLDLAGARFLTVLNLFDEEPGSGETVRDLAITLVADPRNHARVGIFKTPPGALPFAVIKIGAVANGQFNFSLKVTDATSAVPSRCPNTTLTSTFIFGDGTNPQVKLTTTQPWLCFGAGNKYLKSPPP